MKQLVMQYWRIVLAHLPLPTLALAASYGVYTFNLLFVPEWVAITSAASFELTYIGLAVAALAPSNTRRATYISGSAVAVSIVYNSLAALFTRQPTLLSLPGYYGLAMDTVLAILHGLPLALVAYFVADLLLHSKAIATPATKLQQTRRATPALPGYKLAVASSESSSDVSSNSATGYTCPSCSSGLPNKQAQGSAKRLGYCKSCKNQHSAEV